MMPEPHVAPPDDPVNAEVRHEPGDASFGGVLLFGLAMIVIGVLLQFGLVWVYRTWTRWDLADKRQEYGRAAAFAPQPAPGARPSLPMPPALEGLENRRQMVDWRKPFEARAESYGWVDQKAGVVHIPVPQAAAIVARTAAVRKTPPGGTAAGGSTVAGRGTAAGEAGPPGSSSSGRTLQEARP